jgi:antirestriction protein ArdC
MNVYEIITTRIIESLSQGFAPWRKPWSSRTPRNPFSGREYRGVNVLLLQAQPFDSENWMTFNQAQSVGGHIKKGERGTPVVFYKVTEKEQTDGTTKKGFVLRYFTVFNLQQTEGVPIEMPAKENRAINPIAACEKVVDGYANPPSIVHGGDRAAYSPSMDRIQIPSRERFSSSEEFYSTIFHELAHSTGHADRLARKGVVDASRFQSHGYAFEELVAEITNAFLCSHAGIAPATLDNSAAYIATWAKVLKSEPRWIVEASAQAVKAAELVMGSATSVAEPAEQAA